ncbi:MAG: hypothetical protein EON58_20610, partial [Alphaproteobacteria bacterium]
VCVAPSDPWSMTKWASEIDPEGRIRFLSDGNLEFARATGLNVSINELFLGEAMMRFSMVVHDGVVDKINIERSVLDVSCSSASKCMPERKAAA